MCIPNRHYLCGHTSLLTGKSSWPVEVVIRVCGLKVGTQREIDITNQGGNIQLFRSSSAYYVLGAALRVMETIENKIIFFSRETYILAGNTDFKYRNVRVGS